MSQTSPVSEGLEPCPVCRSRLVSLFERQEGLFVVSCENDDCHFGVEAMGSSAKDAVRQWNHRFEFAQTAAVRLEARPADDSQPWTEIFPVQLEWIAKQGHQVRAIELSDTSTDRFGTPNAITTASLEAAERGEGEVVAVFSPEGDTK